MVYPPIEQFKCGLQLVNTTQWCNIFHALRGSATSDINVLDWSSIFFELVEGCAPVVNYSINGNDYTMGYYLADGIYPKWSTFVKTIPSPQGEKRKCFAKLQESTRKDVERAFGVLQAQFAIIRQPARFFYLKTLRDIMKACIILHNMHDHWRWARWKRNKRLLPLRTRRGKSSYCVTRENKLLYRVHSRPSTH